MVLSKLSVIISRDYILLHARLIRHKFIWKRPSFFAMSGFFTYFLFTTILLISAFTYQDYYLTQNTSRLHLYLFFYFIVLKFKDIVKYLYLFSVPFQLKEAREDPQAVALHQALLLVILFGILV